MAGETTADDARFDVSLRGIEVDGETHCTHYNTERDVIAIRFRCCDVFYPCFECHEACCAHEAMRWSPERFGEPAVLCGVCDEVLRIETYLACDHRCPNCEAPFNPGCANHWDRYFAVDS
jgi:uncharacterized CHY-type Zn-finger protein